MFYLLLAILALGVLVIVHEAGHFLVARLSKMRVELFSVGFGPSLFRVTRGETTYQVAAVPLGGFVQIAGMNPGEVVDKEDPRAYPNRPVWQRVATIFAGPGINYLFAALLLIALNLAVGVQVPGPGAVVSFTKSGKPAAQAGIKPGDQIVAIDDLDITDMGQVSRTIARSGGKKVRITVLREGQRKIFEVSPQKDENTYRIGIGVAPTAERKHMGTWVAIHTGLAEPLYLTWANLRHLIEGARGREKLEVGGPVEIVQVMKSKISMGWVPGIEIVAFISTMLGFFNLLPFPALDGGRLVFLTWEVITRRPVNHRVEQTVHTAGMVVLLALIGFLLFRGFRNALFGG